MTQGGGPVPTQSVLVTGAAHRIGAACVRRFAAAGFGVVVHFSRSQRAAEALAEEVCAGGGRATAVGFDLADPGALARGMQRAAAAAPDLSVLVNNASAFDFDRPEAPDHGVWSTAMTVNAFAPAALAAALVKARPDAERVSVVNILDQKLANLNPDFFSYTASKAALGVAGLLLGLACGERVRVANVAPGLSLPSADQTDEEFLRSATINALRRRTTPEDVAEGVFFAAQGSLAHGETLYVDGGQRLVRLDRDVMFKVREGEPL